MELPDNLLTLFTAETTQQDGSIVIEVPQREVAMGSVDSNEVYRVAVLSKAHASEQSETRQDEYGPPVSEGDIVNVEIEDIGDQGDGVARVGDGYVVIVSDADLGERVSVEITEARENVAFAEIVERLVQ